MHKYRKIIIITILLLLIGPFYLLLHGDIKLGQNWHTASRAPTHILQKYHLKNKAVVALFAAKAFSWRGMFSTHTWIAIKNTDDIRYTTYQVFGWNHFLNRPYIDVSYGQPDRLWYGYKPQLIQLTQGDQAKKLIPQIKQAVKTYPYANKYYAWPGPNSNTFIQYILDQVPELNMQLPFNSVGWDFIPSFSWFHVSIWGIFGYHILKHGFTITLLGLTFGLQWQPWAVIVPGIGIIDV